MCNSGIKATSATVRGAQHYSAMVCSPLNTSAVLLNIASNPMPAEMASSNAWSFVQSFCSSPPGQAISSKNAAVCGASDATAGEANVFQTSWGRRAVENAGACACASVSIGVTTSSDCEPIIGSGLSSAISNPFGRRDDRDARRFGWCGTSALSGTGSAPNIPGDTIALVAAEAKDAESALPPPAGGQSADSTLHQCCLHAGAWRWCWDGGAFLQFRQRLRCFRVELRSRWKLLGSP